MIPSLIECRSREVQKQKDIPRQSMATMALSFAQRLVPSLALHEPIARSLRYIEENIEAEPSANKLFALLYLALERVYGGHDPERAVERMQAALSAELFQYPIAANLYLRLSNLLPKPLPHAAYVTETQRYNLSLVPRRHRFFDYADALMWGKRHEPDLASKERQYLLSCMTKDHWFVDPRTRSPVLASVAGKFFEVFAYHDENAELAEAIYTRLMREKVSSQYAKDVLGIFADFILSEPNTLRIDDAHFHILVGLCYRYQALV